MKGARRDAIALAAATILGIAHAMAAPSDVASLVAAIEATYLYKFAAYVDWPAGTFANATDPLGLCVVGDPTFADLVTRAAQGTKAGMHAIIVHGLTTAEPGAPCQIMYLAAAAAPALIGEVRGRPVLTVTGAPAASSSKGIINFAIENNHVRFEIDNQAALADHLKLSSQLLALAINARPGIGK